MNEWRVLTLQSSPQQAGVEKKRNTFSQFQCGDSKDQQEKVSDQPPIKEKPEDCESWNIIYSSTSWVMLCVYGLWVLSIFHFCHSKTSLLPPSGKHLDHVLGALAALTVHFIAFCNKHLQSISSFFAAYVWHHLTMFFQIHVRWCDCKWLPKHMQPRQEYTCTLFPGLSLRLGNISTSRRFLWLKPWLFPNTFYF